MPVSRIDTIFRAVVMWLLFSLFLAISLSVIASSLVLGLIMLVAACVFAPPINRLIEAKTRIRLTPLYRAVIALGCVALFLYTLGKILDINAEKRAAQIIQASQPLLEHAQPAQKP